MKHFVFWSPEADDPLQQLIQEDGTGLFGVSGRLISDWVVANPISASSRFETVRLGVVTPLAVLCDVLDDPPMVIVLDIWRF